MRLKVETNQAYERWRNLAERATSLHAASKQLRDSEPKPAIAFDTKTTALLEEITQAAVNDLDNDADELDLLAYLRDPDLVSALTTAGPRLRDLWLFMSLKGYGLQRKHVKAVIVGYASKLQTLRGRTLRVLRAIEKLRTAEAKPKRTLSRSGATKATNDETATRYSNLERVGEGAYGEVWRADDEKLGRKVALKFIRSTDADQAALAHAKALARVQHPNIVTVHEVHPVTAGGSQVSQRGRRGDRRGQA